MLRAEGWSVVVPVRDFTTAKTRLRTDLPAATVSDIASKLAQGCIRALARTARVAEIIVVSDVQLATEFSAAGVELLVQRPGGGLNGAVREGLQLAGHRRPGAPRLAIHADLPGIHPEAVDALLAHIERGGVDAFVPDRNGQGTTALALMPGSERQVGFGPSSSSRHQGLGYSRINLPASNVLRNDLDTLEELRALAWGSIAPFAGVAGEPLAE